MDDKRIGYLSAAGGVAHWPELDIAGQPYSRPVTTVSLDDWRFVVVPVNFTDWAWIDALRNAQANPHEENDDNS